MKNEFLFLENQRFNQWWLWLFFVGIDALVIFVAHMMYKEDPSKHVFYYFAALIPLLQLICFSSIKLETKIDNEGVYVRFFPFHLRFKFYPWSMIYASDVKKNRAFGESKGWGVRRTSYKKKEYNVFGDMGLHLRFKDGEKLLIGTRKPNEIRDVLEELERL